jgi:hypothetical protein
MDMDGKSFSKNKMDKIKQRLSKRGGGGREGGKRKKTR